MDGPEKVEASQVQQKDDADNVPNEHSNDMVEGYITVKVEKTDAGYLENDVNGNFDRSEIKHGEDGVDGVVDMHEIQVTEISEKEKLELELEIEAEENLLIENVQGESSDIVDGRIEVDGAKECDKSAYTCVLCKQTFHGSDAARAHLEGHISEKGFDCLECQTQYTSSCLQDEHTLIVFELVGDALQGRLYRYISICQLLIKSKSENYYRQVDGNKVKDHTQLDSFQESSNASDKTNTCIELQENIQASAKVCARLEDHTKPGENLVKEGRIKTSENVETGGSDGNHTKLVAQTFESTAQGNPFHFEAAALKEKTNISSALEHPYICMACYRRFSTSVDLDQHLLLLHNQMNSHICPNCNLLFDNEKKLKVHLKQNENIGCDIHICSICDKIFKKQEQMKTHMYKHTGRGSYECHLCKKKWKNRSVLNRHLESHGTVKKYLCSVCNKLFSTANSLKVHMNIHTGERMFPCPICDKVYSEQRFLRVHMCTHSGEGKFSCKFCSKKFYSASQLKLHLCKHTGERPHVCKICNEAFLVKNSLLRHMYRHNGLKPYSCITCGKAFVLKQDLSEHAKIHAVRSHICKICERGFTTGAYLNRHMKQHRSRGEGHF